MVILLWIICPFQEVFTMARKSYLPDDEPLLVPLPDLQALVSASQPLAQFCEATT